MPYLTPELGCMHLTHSARLPTRYPNLLHLPQQAQAPYPGLSCAPYNQSNDGAIDGAVVEGRGEQSDLQHVGFSKTTVGEVYHWSIIPAGHA